MNTNKQQKNKKKNKNEERSKILAGIKEECSSTLDRSKYSLELVNGWIIAADTKVSISCGVFSFMVAVLVFVAENILNKIDKSAGVNTRIYLFFIVAMVISAITFLISIFLHLKAISPSFKSEERIKRNCCPLNKDINMQNDFSLFYDKIRRFESPEEYIQSAHNCSEKQFEEEVLREVYINSGICTNKMKRFKRGIWLGWISILLIVSCSILYYCAYIIH